MSSRQIRSIALAAKEHSISDKRALSGIGGGFSAEKPYSNHTIPGGAVFPWEILVRVFEFIYLG